MSTSPFARPEGQTGAWSVALPSPRPARPFFEDEELVFYLQENNNDFNATAYHCLIIKSENTTLNVSGLNCADTSQYFRRLAQRYRKNNSGILNA